MAREPMQRFDRSFRAWADRSPEMSAEEAAGQFLDRLSERDSQRSRADHAHPGWHWANAIVAVALVTVISLRFDIGLQPADPAASTDSSDSTNDSASASAPLEPRPLPDGVVVMWLDSETPLYLTMNAPEVDHGDPSS